MTARVLALATLLLAGCVTGSGTVTVPAAPDAQAFRWYIQPLMDISCASIDCHGQARRPLHLYSVDGLRIADGLRTLDPVDVQRLTPDEVVSNIASIVTVDAYDAAHPENDIVVKKPLAIAAGGMHHVGGEIWPSATDPGYLCVRDWLGGATASDAHFTAECTTAVTSIGGVPYVPDVDAGPVADAGPAPDASGGAWSTVYTTVLRPFCSGCHTGSVGSGTWTMGTTSHSAYASLVGVTAHYCPTDHRVTSGDSAHSGLVLTLTGSTCGSQMPPRSRLTDAQIALVTAWIDSGAPEN